MHDRFERRIEQKLQAMAEGCGKRKQDPLKVAQRVGRLLGKNSRAAACFRWTWKPIRKDGSSALDQTRRAARLDEVIRGMLPAAQQRDRLERRKLWRAYIQLTEAEEAFRSTRATWS